MTQRLQYRLDGKHEQRGYISKLNSITQTLVGSFEDVTRFNFITAVGKSNSLEPFTVFADYSTDGSAVINSSQLNSGMDTNFGQHIICPHARFFRLRIERSFNLIDISQYTAFSYGSQDIQSTAYSVVGTEINLTGNTWKYINYPYTITADTVLEIEYKRSIEPELGLFRIDTPTTYNDITLWSTTFKFAGTQAPLPGEISDFSYTETPGTYQQFVIPVGTYLTGPITILAFANDDDALIGADSCFRNIKLYEPVLGVETQTILHT